MGAWVSALAGIAVVESGQTFSIVDAADRSNTPVNDLRVLRQLLANYPDIEYMADDLTARHALEVLDQSRERTRGLLLTLSVLDPELSEATRSESAVVLDRLLENNHVQQFVRAVLFTAPLPRDADPEGARRISTSANCARVDRCFSDVLRLEPFRRIVDKAWKEAAAGHFDEDDQARDAERLFTNQGVLAGLIHDLGTRASSQVGAWVIRCAADARLRSVPRLTQLLNRIAANVNFALGEVEERARVSDLRSLRQHDQVLSDWAEPSRRDKRSRWDWKNMDWAGIKEDVGKQIEAISRAIRRGDLHRASKFLLDLAELQSSREGTAFLVKSLCNVAQVAYRSRQLEFAEQLLRWALELQPTDSWTWQQLAVVLLNRREFDRALEASRQAIQLGTGPAGYGALAAILESKSDYDGALEAYDAILSDFPEERRALVGRAHVFAARGDYERALVLYNEVLEEFPEDAFARNGRAEVLKAQGRYEDALEAYKETLEVFPNDAATRNGYAEVLKAQGRYEDALEAYEGTLGLFPNDPFTRNGRAEVLKAQGRYEEALEAYEETLEVFPNDAVTRNGYAEALKAQGRYGEALGAYEETLGLFPNNLFARNGRAEILRAQGRYEDALEAYRGTLQLFPNNAFARCGRAEVLKTQGNYQEALAAYDEALRMYPKDAVALNGRAEVLKTAGRYQDALTSYDEILRLFPHNKITLNCKTTVLILMKEIGAAQEMLLTKPPESEEEWVAYHTRGLFYLRQNELTKATTTFESGRRCPFDNQRPHFLTALGATYIRAQQFEEASVTLQELDGHLDAVTSVTRDLILVHSLAEEGEIERAERTLSRAHVSRGSLVGQLRDALMTRYRLGRDTKSSVNYEIGEEMEEFEFRVLAEGPSIRHQGETTSLALPELLLEEQS